ncbi:MAG: trypsin-like peptidase domain-containing protein [Planctomycetota bacterium]
MKPWRFILLALAPIAAFRAQADPPPAEPARERPPAIAQWEDGLRTLVDGARPWLVQIACHYKVDEQKDGGFSFANEFSGVVLSVENGEVYVVTVGSAVRGARKVEVIAPDGNDFSAETVGLDEVTNLAVVRFDPGDAKFTPARFGDSDKVRPGSFVLALGNPFGLEGSVSNGIVSGVKRSIGGTIQPMMGMLQVTAPINPGDAGGLLLDSRGDVIGVLASTFQRASAYDDLEGVFDKFLEGFDWEKFLEKVKQKKDGQELLPGDLKSLVEKLMNERKKALLKSRRNDLLSVQQLGAEGINFAIPSNLVRVIAGQLKANGKVERGYLGIRVMPLENALRKHLGLQPGRGLVVTLIEPGSPAAQAGLQLYDVIMEVDGKDVSDVSSLAEIIGGKKQGDSVILKVRRGQEDKDLSAILGKK